MLRKTELDETAFFKNLIADNDNYFENLLGSSLSIELIKLLNRRDKTDKNMVMLAISERRYKVAVVILRKTSCLKLLLRDKSNHTLLDLSFIHRSNYVYADLVYEVLQHAVRKKVYLPSLTRDIARMTQCLEDYPRLFNKETLLFQTKKREFLSVIGITNDRYSFNGYHHVWKAETEYRVLKQKVQDNTWPHKLHLSLGLAQDVNLFLAAWKILLTVYPDIFISEFKLIDIHHPKRKYQPGKEAVVYLVNKKHLHAMSDAEYLAKHITIMRKIDRLIAEAQLTCSAAPVSKEIGENGQEKYTPEYATEPLGCRTQAIYISPPDHVLNPVTQKIEYLSALFGRPTPQEHPYKGECVVLANLFELSPLLLAMLDDQYQPDATLPWEAQRQLIEFKAQFVSCIPPQIDSIRLALQSACRNELQAYAALREIYLEKPSFLKASMHNGDGFNSLYSLFDSRLDQLRRLLSGETTPAHAPGMH